MGSGQGGCERRIEFLWENSKQKSGGGGGVGGSGGRGGVRVDVNEELSFCENSKKKFGGGCGVGSGLGGGGSGWMWTKN